MPLFSRGKCVTQLRVVCTTSNHVLSEAIGSLSGPSSGFVPEDNGRTLWTGAPRCCMVTSSSALLVPVCPEVRPFRAELDSTQFALLGSQLVSGSRNALLLSLRADHFRAREAGPDARLSHAERICSKTTREELRRTPNGWWSVICGMPGMLRLARSRAPRLS